MTHRPGRRLVVAAIACLCLGGLACERAPVDPRPSIVLIVADTTRQDAVSAYGRVEGTTPFIDRLAAEGALYEEAFAPAPWTLPSHATLLTGLAPERHGVGMNHLVILPEQLPTVAEALTGAGYEAVGFSENPLVSRQGGFGRGFDHFESEVDTAMLRDHVDPDIVIDIPRGVRTWGEKRDRARPYFLFVNLVDAHSPYKYLPEHDFLPPGVNRDAIRKLDTGGDGRTVAEAVGLCDRIPTAFELEILHQLYLGEVASVDDQIRAIVAAARDATDGDVIVIVTSDHGEHLGEHRLVGHEFSVRDELLRIPLVVHGAPGVEPGTRIATPVGLADVADAIRAWGGIAGAEPLPARTIEPPEPRALTAFWSDMTWIMSKGFDEEVPEKKRIGCGPEDRVFGDMLTVTRENWKLIWYTDNPPELFDKSWDRAEKSDVAAHHPDVVAELDAHLEPLREEMKKQDWRPEVDSHTAEALRALGYAE